jgi:hypothetical protein
MVLCSFTLNWYKNAAIAIKQINDMAPIDTRKPIPEVQAYLRQRAIYLRQQRALLDESNIGQIVGTIAPDISNQA